MTTTFLKDGKHMERNIQCNILVGTDCAGSTVRKLAGVDLKGEKDLQKLVSVHFMSLDLGDYLLNERPGMLFFVFNTEVIGVLVAHDLKQGEFVLQIPFFPPQQNLEDFSPEPWVMHAEVAEKYFCCDSQMILSGDAAHRFPPAGGFGMNTGIQDAHNLPWKIASVVKGLAPSVHHQYFILMKQNISGHCFYSFTCPTSIPLYFYSYDLTSVIYYCQIAISNTALSVQNFIAAMAVPSALGLDPTVANFVHQIINKAVGPILPSVIQKEVLDRIFKVGRAQLSESLLNESSPLGSFRLANLRHIFEEGSLQLQFPAEDLGFRKSYLHSILFLEIKIKFLLIKAPLEDSYDLARSAFKVAEGFKVSIKLVNDVSSTLEKSQLDIHIIATKDDYNRRYMKMLSL
ncbi:hypothetical protein Q3G72_009839 [Acer saccharum]|nr:hypothetical protein Q3G72_009839 [Acer saccharum]